MSFTYLHMEKNQRGIGPQTPRQPRQWRALQRCGILAMLSAKSAQPPLIESQNKKEEKKEKGINKSEATKTANMHNTS